MVGKIKEVGSVIAHVKCLSAVAFNQLVKGFTDTSREYEQFIKEHKRYDLEELNLDLKHGRIPNSKKIEFLIAELYEITRGTKHIDEYIKLITFLYSIDRTLCEKKLEVVDRRIRIIGGLLSITVLGAIAFTGLIGIVEASEKLCHPGGDATVYRDSGYCVRLKSLEEFFVGKGQVK